MKEGDAADIRFFHVCFDAADETEERNASTQISILGRQKLCGIPNIVSGSADKIGTPHIPC